jgi:ribosomal protein S12 methylthiotransferase accessory factor
MVARMANTPLPEHPRLRRGCSLFQDGSELILRSVKGAFLIATEHRPSFEALLRRLDGRGALPALLAQSPAAAAFYALRMLSNFHEVGLLADGPLQASPSPEDGTTAVACPQRLEWVARAELSTALRAAFHAHAGRTIASDQPAVRIAALDVADFGQLQTFWHDARLAKQPLLVLFPFGDALVVGPMFSPGEPGCPRCLERRWLGLSSTVALERRYLGRRASDELLISDAPTAAEIAAFARPFVAEILSASKPLLNVSLQAWEIDPPFNGLLEPWPHCNACGSNAPANAAPNWQEPALGLGALMQHLAPIVDHPFGLATSLPPNDSAPHHEDLPHIALSRFAFPEPEVVFGGQQNWAHGAAERSEDARTLALVEALERYNGLSPPHACVWASYAEVADRALRPDALPLFSKQQYAKPNFPFTPFDEEQPIKWAQAWNLTQQRPVLVPASAAWYGFDDSLLGDCSNGVAAHSSAGLALVNGVLELIERDAFMIHWLNRMAPPRVAVASLNDERATRLLKAVEFNGYEPLLLDITTDLGIPAFLALGVHRAGEKPALRVGAGAALVAGQAVRRALNELYAASHGPGPLWRPAASLAPTDVVTLADHGHAYAHPDWLDKAAFLWSSAKQAEPPSALAHLPAPPLATLISRLADHGHEVIGVDITAPDIAKHHLSIVRAIVPGLQPLALGPGPRLGGRRPFDVPVRMGARRQPAVEADLNLVPHCFP